MEPNKKIVQIAIKTPLRRAFDYVSDDNPSALKIGQRVKVPFGRRDMTGVIVGLIDESAFPAEKLKSITTLIDSRPLIPEKLLTLYHWASDYYQHPIGEVILGTLPKKIRDGFVCDSDSVGDGDSDGDHQPTFELSSEQKNAIDIISQTKQFQPFLLHGVTGSGKTEVYLRVIADALKKNQQALVLVPEISLTPQTVARFEARFHVPVLLLHSGLTDKKRSEAWLRATKNTPCIVIGTRSAVFAPLHNCGVIVVDEEHDSSFKQQSGFRYSARDVAVMRAKLENIPVILGTATPSLESWKNVQQKKYYLLTLSERAGNATLPPITLHNICKEKLQNGLSEKLISVMRAHLNRDNQVLLFLNRRGYAPVLMCHDCGYAAICPHCDARLTAHHHPKRLLCHHCGYACAWIRICPSCKQSELMALGMGTEQLEQTLSALFPNKKVGRIDRDCVKTFSELKKIFQQVHDREIDIVIGTQMLVKGHHFEHVTLVAAVDVDHALFSSDFRAIERLGQSLIQVAGRAGRSEKCGEVFIQTHHPDHPLLKILFESHYDAFANAILSDREKMQLPPYNNMILLRAEAKNKEKLHLFLEQAKKQMQMLSAHIEIMGPFPSVLEKKANLFRMQLLLQSPHRAEIKKALSGFLASQEQQKKTSGLKWALDVDPIEI